MYVETARSSKSAASAFGQDEVPGAHARRDGLRERRRVRDEGASLELEQARRRLALEAHEPVRIVLEHGQLVLPRDLDQPRASLVRERSTARVLEGRNRVQEGRRIGARAKLGVERVGVEALVVHREGHDLDAFAREHLERAVVARCLDEDAPGSTRELLGGVEDESLQAPDGEDDALGGDAVALRDPLA